jgi:ribosomal protein S27AE
MMKKFEEVQQTFQVSDLRAYVGKDNKVYMTTPPCPQCGALGFMPVPVDHDSKHGHLKRCLAQRIIALEHVSYSEDEARAAEEAAKVAEATAAMESYYSGKGDSVLTNEFNGTNSLNLTRD